MTDVTGLLNAVSAGDERAAARLLPVVYDELRRLAVARMQRLPPGQTLQPTALVHEAYIALVGIEDPGWNGRGHFFGAAARAMRDILVDRARRKAAPKHGGDLRRVALDDHAFLDTEIETPAEDMIELDAALRRLEADHPRDAEIVMLRYFTGMTNLEVATALGISSRTVERSWRFARARLHGELSCALREPRRPPRDDG